MIMILKWFQENHAFILTCATIVLVIITFFYLIETRSIRKIAERTFLADTNPKVFIQEIIPKPRFKEESKSIEVSLIFKIKNAGKTEATDVAVDYYIRSEDVNNHTGKKTISGTVGPIQYLFPAQEFLQETKMLVVTLNANQVDIVKQSIEQKKPLIIKKDTYPSLVCNLELSYLDQSVKRITYPYDYEYLFHENKLVDKNRNSNDHLNLNSK